MRDNHLHCHNQIHSRKIIESCMDEPNNETYHIV